MPIYVSDGGGKDFAPAPEGSHAAICCDVVDLGEEENPFKPGSFRRRVRIGWLISEKMSDGRPFFVSRNLTASLNEKATLRQMLEAWRGKKLSADEASKFDLEGLIGAPALVQIVHEQKTDRVFAAVKAVMKLPKGMQGEVPSLDGFVRRGAQAPVVEDSVITDAQHTLLKATQRENKIPDDAYRSILKMYNYKSGKDIKRADFENVLEDLKNWIG